jgi:hypothetical protein
LKHPARWEDRLAQAGDESAGAGAREGIMAQSDSSIEELFTGFQERLVIQASDLSLASLADMVDAKALDIAPDFQRRQRWSHARQAQLIESFLINVPVPPIYLAEVEYGVYSVIDGKQRLTAIYSFMRDKLRLRDLRQFPQLEGQRFSDLPLALQNALRVRPYVRAIILLRQTESPLKYEVFMRLNSAGVPLLPQELRNAAFRGRFNDKLVQSSRHPFLRAQLKITGDQSPNFQKMVDVEWTLRFLTLRTIWNAFSGDLRGEMDRFMLVHHQEEDGEGSHALQRFTRAIGYAEQLWGSVAFKRPEAGTWRDQAIAGMYDSEMLAIDILPDDTVRGLTQRRQEVVEATRDLFQDPAFSKAVRQGTNAPGFVRLRVESMVDALRGL